MAVGKYQKHYDTNFYKIKKIFMPEFTSTLKHEYDQLNIHI